MRCVVGAAIFAVAAAQLQPQVVPLRLGERVEFNTAQAGWLPGAVIAMRQDGSVDVQAVPAVGGGLYQAWRPENIRHPGSSTSIATAQHGAQQAAVCKSLNTTTWMAREKHISTFSWEAATDREIRKSYNKAKTIRGQDDSGRWFGVTITHHNADGTYSGRLEDTNDLWEPLWTQFLQIKRPHAPKTTEVNVMHSACQNYPTRCARTAAPAVFETADAKCLKALKPAWWGVMSTEQAQAITVPILSILPATSCAALQQDTIRGIDCDSPISVECAQSLTENALTDMQSRCAGQLPDEFFQHASEDLIGAVLSGQGGDGISARQISKISRDGCLGIDPKMFTERGQAGEALCKAVPQYCWTTAKMSQGFASSSVPRSCLASLNAKTIATMTTPAMTNGHPEAFCDLGVDYLKRTLNSVQRGSIDSSMCKPCNLPQGHFHQCRTSVIKAVTASWGSSSTSQCLLLSAATVAAFFVGIAVRQNRRADHVQLP